MTAYEAPDYLAIGHITIDLRPDGTPVLGGTALYAALTAARFGLRAAILTRGNFANYGDEISTALARFASEIEIIVQNAKTPTTFINRQVAGRREQTVTAWAGQIDLSGLPPAWRSSGVVHLGPVAQEIDLREAGKLSPGYLGVTPQGWMRNWTASQRGVVRLEHLRLPPAILGRVDAMVLSAEERSLARDDIDPVAARGLVAITRGVAGTQIIDRGRIIEIPAYVSKTVDDTGAGDIYAATLFLLRAEREPTAASARRAAAAAALRVQSAGPDAVPTRAAVEAFLQSAEEVRARPRH